MVIKIDRSERTLRGNTARELLECTQVTRRRRPGPRPPHAAHQAPLGSRRCTPACERCTWHAHDMHKVCTRCAHGMHMACTWYAHGMHMVCTCMPAAPRASSPGARAARPAPPPRRARAAGAAPADTDVMSRQTRPTKPTYCRHKSTTRRVV